jgi:hypothetical protein
MSSTLQRDTERTTFLDMVRDLTRTHQHREPYTAELASGTTWSAHHTTTVPSLVAQLLGAAPAGSESMSGAHPQSRPAARVEALDTVMLIDGEAGEWLDRLGEVIPADRYVDGRRYHPAIGPTCERCHHRSCTAIQRGDYVERRIVRGSGTIRSITMLGALHPSVAHCRNHAGTADANGRWCCLRHELERDVRHWWHAARIVTGWDTPAFRPHNTCPVCDQRDSLRIRIDAALCVECRSIWEGADQLNVLARHIQEENGDT